MSVADFNGHVDLLRQKVRELQDRSVDIQAQLSSRAKVYPSEHERAGQRMSDKDYWDWKQKALWAQRHVVSELRQAKDELAKAFASSEGQDPEYLSTKDRLRRLESKVDEILNLVRRNRESA